MSEKELTAELEALITEREGYVAENEHRARLGLAPAYGEDYFLELADRMRLLSQSQPITEDDVRWAFDDAVGKLGDGKGTAHMIEFLRSKGIVVEGDGQGDLTKDTLAKEDKP